MSLTPALKHGLLIMLYTALGLSSLDSLWPLLPAPAFAWSLVLGIAAGLPGAALSWLFRRRPPQLLTGLDWVLLLNALLLWAVILLELPNPGGHG
ncbi:MAG: hypothetical protein ACAI44_27465 [Candidatus Sericytochromatia bacterium]